jgi:hypothetical protein
LKKREEIIQELEKEKKIISLDKSVIENNLLLEKYEKQTSERDQKQLHEKHNKLNEKYEQLKQQVINNFSNLQKQISDYKN